MSDNKEMTLVDAEPPVALAATAQRTPTVTGSTANDLLLYVMQNGGSIAEVREFMQLKREYEADEARKAYVADMAQFKLNPPTIVKDKAVGYTNKDGTFTGYKHASLGNVTNAIVEGLARHGFSHRWDVKQEGAIAHVTCTITHRLGHSESVAMQAAKDDSGKKNAIQQVASAVAYLQRYTLLAATGLATHDQDDDDGASSEAPAEEKAQPKPTLIGPQYENAKKAIAAGKYTIEEAREYYELTAAQNAELSMLAKGGAK